MSVALTRRVLAGSSFNTFPHLAKALALYNTTSGVKPWWLAPTRDKLRANGLLEDSERWAVSLPDHWVPSSFEPEPQWYLCEQAKSDRLYVSNWKMLTEAIRKSTYVSGYECQPHDRCCWHLGCIPKSASSNRANRVAAAGVRSPAQ